MTAACKIKKGKTHALQHTTVFFLSLPLSIPTTNCDVSYVVIHSFTVVLQKINEVERKTHNRRSKQRFSFCFFHLLLFCFRNTNEIYYFEDLIQIYENKIIHTQFKICCCGVFCRGVSFWLVIQYFFFFFFSFFGRENTKFCDSSE